LTGPCSRKKRSDFLTPDAGHGEFFLTVNPSISGPQGRQVILIQKARRDPFFVLFVLFVA
jgi:hypothetical protein